MFESLKEHFGVRGQKDDVSIEEFTSAVMGKDVYSQPKTAAAKPRSESKGTNPSIDNYSTVREWIKATGKGKDLDYYLGCSPGAFEALLVTEATHYTRFAARANMTDRYLEKEEKEKKKSKETVYDIPQGARARRQIERLEKLRDGASGKRRLFLERYLTVIDHHGGRVADAYDLARKKQKRLAGQERASMQVIKAAVLDVGALRLGGATGVVQAWPDAFADIDVHIGGIHIHPKDWVAFAAAGWVVGTTVLADYWRKRREARIVKQEEKIWEGAKAGVTEYYQQATGESVELWESIFGHPPGEHAKDNHHRPFGMPEYDGNGTKSYA